MLCLAQQPVLGAGVEDTQNSADSAVELAETLAIERARPEAPILDRAAFIREPALQQVLQSPDGLQIAWLQRGAERASVWVMDTDGAPARALQSQGDTTRLYWSRDSRWVFAQSPTRLLALSAAGSEGSTLIATLKPGNKQQVYGADPGHPAAMLLIEETQPADTGQAQVHQVWRVDRQGQRTLLLEDPRPLVDLAFNPEGRLSYFKRFDGDAFAILHLDGTGSRREVARCSDLRRCTLVSADADESLWLIGNLDTNLASLQRIDPDGRTQTLHHDPRGEADLRELTLDPASFKPLIAHYGSTLLHSHALDTTTKAWLQPIIQAFPDARLQISMGTDPGAPALIGVSSSQSALTRWFLRWPTDPAVHVVLDDLRQASLSVPESAAARKIPVQWPASDGLQLHGFVSVPPGSETANLPLVVKVHGGPWTLTDPDYSASTQFLVNRGYAVFEPNFRGSTGLGRHYLLAAKGDFGHGRVQQDIVEGTRWLLANGIGDRQRVAIIGASFGGYAALLGVTHEPELFKLAIAAVPPSDFAWTLRWAVEFQVLELETTVPFEQTLRTLDLDVNDAPAMARLSAGSPCPRRTNCRDRWSFLPAARTSAWPSAASPTTRRVCWNWARMWTSTSRGAPATNPTVPCLAKPGCICWSIRYNGNWAARHQKLQKPPSPNICSAISASPAGACCHRQTRALRARLLAQGMRPAAARGSAAVTQAQVFGLLGVTPMSLSASVNAFSPITYSPALQFSAPRLRAAVACAAFGSLA